MLSCPDFNSATQVVAILASGQALPFTVASVKLELPELQVCLALYCFNAILRPQLHSDETGAGLQQQTMRQVQPDVMLPRGDRL
jgi:hypothetical protein